MDSFLKVTQYGGNNSEIAIPAQHVHERLCSITDMGEYRKLLFEEGSAVRTYYVTESMKTLTDAIGSAY